MSEELKELLFMLEEEIKKRKNLPCIQSLVEDMRELLFEAAEEFKPIQVSKLRHIASLKLRKDGICDYYEVTNKQIRDVFEKYDKLDLLPKVRTKK